MPADFAANKYVVAVVADMAAMANHSYARVKQLLWINLKLSRVEQLIVYAERSINFCEASSSMMCMLSFSRHVEAKVDHGNERHYVPY